MSGIIIDRGRMEARKAAVRRDFSAARSRLEREVAEKTRQAAIHVAHALAERTFPSAQAIGLTVRAVRFDVGRVFITSGRAYEILRETAGTGGAGAFYAAWKRGDLAAARSILRASGGPLAETEIGPLRPEVHESARNPQTGRVMLARPAMIVAKSDLAAYVRTVVAEIGKTASGWNSAAVALGGGDSPTRWKSEKLHGSGGGATELREAGKAGFAIRNDRPLARKHISPGQLARVLAEGKTFLMEMLRER